MTKHNAALHKLHVLNTKRGTARNGPARRPTATARDDSYTEMTTFRLQISLVLPLLIEPRTPSMIGPFSKTPANERKWRGSRARARRGHGALVAFR